MKVSQILQKKGSFCHSIESGKSLAEAVKTMMDNRIGSLLVIDQGKLEGIITERDVMWSVNEFGHKVPEAKVRDVMSKKLVSCHGQCTVADAMDLMTKNETGKRIRHLPVIDQGELMGVISIGDIMNTLLQETVFENKLLKNYIKHWPEEGS